MATYAENAATSERRTRTRVQDRHLAALRRSFDLSAKDNHMKYERPSFAVVTASAEFRAGWDRIFGKGVVCEPPAEKPASAPRPESTAG